jgi:hypothetical protein
MTTDPITAGGTGRGWPDPTEPGVPAAALHDGYHWLQEHDGGLIVAQWSPDSWSWILGQNSGRFCPEEMDHFNYLGPSRPPPRSRQPRITMPERSDRRSPVLPAARRRRPLKIALAWVIIGASICAPIALAFFAAAPPP